MEAPPSEPAVEQESVLEPEEERQLTERFNASAPIATLEKALDDPATEVDLLAVLARRLGENVTPRTWGDVTDAFGNYVGVRDAGALEPTDLLTLGALDPASNLPVMEKTLAERPKVFAFVRRAIASYAPEIVAAYDAYGESPHDWRSIHPRVFHDVTRGQPHIELRIEKFGGETAFLEGGPTSMLRLTRSLITALAAVPTVEAFEADAAGTFVEEASAFVGRLQEQLDESAKAEAATPAAAPEQDPGPP